MNTTETQSGSSLQRVVRTRWNNYAVWRRQLNDRGVTQWIQTGHRLKGQSDKDAEARLRRCFEGCGLHSMSLVAVKEGESPNEKLTDRSAERQ